MPFIPHTEQETVAMLAAIGVERIEDLFDEIPPALKNEALAGIPEAMSEMEVVRLMQLRAGKDRQADCFIGAGAYRHHIPAAVWEIAARGEYYSAYTPYQAEASQGTLQLLYEFQTMISRLTAMEVANASLYDGASSLAEAVLMAVRANRKSTSGRILMPRTVHPAYRKVVTAIVKNQHIEVHELDYQLPSGHIDPATLPTSPGDIAALVIPLPNFFGVIEEVAALTDWAHHHNALVIAVVNPIALALLTPPGEWGARGADIVCGEGQPLGVPLSGGGPYFGFMCCKRDHVRQMPGRIAGRTTDLEGDEGFTLTLQAREQHIRRAKATSNICTNQGLLVTAATIYMALLGDQGMQQVAASCHANIYKLLNRLTAIGGVSQVFDRPVFHEAVLQLDAPVTGILKALAARNVLGGYPLVDDYPELGNTMLVCATEVHTDDDIEQYAARLRSINA